MKISLIFSEYSPMIVFAMSKLKTAISEIGETWINTQQQDCAYIVILTSGNEAQTKYGLTIDAEINTEGFEIRRSHYCGNSALFVLAYDQSGAMYGVLELAERLRTQEGFLGVSECVINARFSFRALKFNLPWSSYRKNECFNLQKETVRDLAFWQSFLDMMAENRYNVLTLWGLHPFPYMIKSASFPKATPFSDEELADWKEFWSSLFRMARNRGIETYLIDWNIFVSESFREHYDSNAVSDESFYHHGDYYSTEQIKQYTRECVTQVIDEYPDLAGLGVSLGERMNGMTPQERQDWIADTYYEAMRNAGRPIKFIHRAPFSIDASIMKDSVENDLPAESVWVEMKFNWSHSFSTPKLVMTHGGSQGMEGFWEPKPQNYKLTWMIRNEDFFTLRWAQPNFVREMIQQNGHDYVGGFYVGSECFIPAYDYSHQPGSHIQWSYAFEKHWLYYMLWGRLLYDPATPDDIFVNAIVQRYGSSVGRPLLEAYAAVCKMPMALASFFFSTWDFTLYSEGFLATDKSEYNSGKAFISLEDLLNSQTLEPTYLSIRSYLDRTMNTESVEGFVTPIMLADTLEKDGRQGLALLAGISGDSPCLECEMADIKAWAHLSLYFAAKLRAGVCYETFVRTGVETHRQEALRWLEPPHAAKHWDDLVEVTASHYVEQPLMHLGNTPFSWRLFRTQVLEDIEFVKGRRHHE